ncbi:hypothetical protein NOS3756_32620 [Nostoc sp. NIES-3756]|uniref:hypothetical protein n=1 Tax=Nostoc sp. NIES-3756 TaxID=1751286 RepID=UPI000722757A|nr:hypothetical protein [Nostoc sp. NIES-3756]BAT54294.1 hypothetical protein NOS3756_32620 [Nostoc sp. NIES-3756]
MSSGSSGRYQSRFFNFVNQQSRRLTQGWENTFHNLQAATKWGVAALLYPVYLLLHSTDESVKQLNTKEPPSRLSLQADDTDFLSAPLTTDRPIVRVLESVQYLPDEKIAIASSRKARFSHTLELLKSRFIARRITQPQISQSLTIPNKTLETNTLKHQLPMVRGVASDLVNRQLVLVSTENQILDILSQQQQAKLTERIINEVGKYWHYRQLNEAEQQSHLVPEINRILAKLTGENRENLANNSFNTGKIFNLLDAAIAQLEETAIVPVQQRSLEMVKVAQTQLSIFLYGQEPVNSRKEIVKNVQGLENQKQNISALIESAINYFFGVPKHKLLDSSFSQQELPDITYQSQHEYFTDDPWLDWQDLYGDPEKMTEKIMESSKTKPSISTSKSFGLFQNKKRTQAQQKPVSDLVNQQKPTFNKAAKKQAAAYTPKQNSTQNQAEAKPDWIDTTATVLGYEKHLIEYILEWLDSVILWVEQILVNIFYFLQGLLRSK